MRQKLTNGSDKALAEDFAANNVLRPHSAAAALAVFEPGASAGTDS